MTRNAGGFEARAAAQAAERDVQANASKAAELKAQYAAKLESLGLRPL